MLLPLWRNIKTGILFLYDYTPRAGLMRGLVEGYNSLPYNFKTYGSRMREMHYAVSAVKDITGCDLAVGIPGSTNTFNNVQRICDSSFRFLPLWSRPRKHKGKVDLSQENQRIRIEARVPIGVQKILLVDDIASTGSTMSTYEAILRSCGVCNIEKFSIAHKPGIRQLVAELKIKDSLFEI